MMGTCHRGHVFMPKLSMFPSKSDMSSCHSWVVFIALERLTAKFGLLYSTLPAGWAPPLPQVLAKKAHSPFPSLVESSQVFWPLITPISVVNPCLSTGSYRSPTQQ